MFASSMLAILAFILVGIIAFLLKIVFNLKSICAENERNLKILMDEKNKDVKKDEDEEYEIPADFSIPDFSDSETESDFDCGMSLGTRSSGYDTEMDHENFLNQVPAGPVATDQIYLTFVCMLTGQHVKAIVDEFHAHIHLVTWTQNELTSEWTPVTCKTCISMVRRTLANKKCTVPFVMDIEATQEEMDNAEEVRRLLDHYERLDETMVYEEEDQDDSDFEDLFKTSVFDDSEDDEEEGFNTEDFDGFEYDYSVFKSDSETYPGY
uniref:RING-type domain-containing protein n=1 Tax=Caenorhabditis tropicalis TaxID=1561998 RepID=A0A1I7TCE7_9PELO